MGQSFRKERADMEMQQWQEREAEKDIDDFIFQDIEWHESER